MTLTIDDLTKDITKVDLDDILSCWQWLLVDMKTVALISCMGDLFLIGKDYSIYWLATDTGSLSKVADSLEQFKQQLTDENQVDIWFHPQLVGQLIIAGKILKENEVYSYKIQPVIGGDYSIDNIERTDISVHFAFSGQICEQIKDLPDRTKVNIKFK